MKIFNKDKFREGDTYAASAGIHAGKLLIIIDNNDDHYNCLATPLMENLTILKETFDSGLENCIIEYVERVPRSVRTVARAKFEENQTQGV